MTFFGDHHPRHSDAHGIIRVVANHTTTPSFFTPIKRVNPYIIPYGRDEDNWLFLANYHANDYTTQQIHYQNFDKFFNPDADNLLRQFTNYDYYNSFLNDSPKDFITKFDPDRYHKDENYHLENVIINYFGFGFGETGSLREQPVFILKNRKWHLCSRLSGWAMLPCDTFWKVMN